MSAFNPNQLPANITTIEQLHVWTATVLHDLYPNITAIEDVGVATRVIQNSPFFVEATNPVTWRLITRTSMPLNTNWRRSKTGIWLHATELGTLPIPTEYQS